MRCKGVLCTPRTFPHSALEERQKDLYLQLVASTVAAHRVQLRMLHLEVTIHHLCIHGNFTIWTAPWHP